MTSASIPIRHPMLLNFILLALEYKVMASIFFLNRSYRGGETSKSLKRTLQGLGMNISMDLEIWMESSGLVTTTSANYPQTSLWCWELSWRHMMGAEPTRSIQHSGRKFPEFQEKLIFPLQGWQRGTRLQIMAWRLLRQCFRQFVRAQWVQVLHCWQK